MGTQLSSILEAREVSLDDLKSRTMAVDAYNMLYQFLTTIRQRDGTPLMDSQGNITSHLSGLFFRVGKMLRQDMKLAFVFDGESPELKNEEKQRRREKKEEAREKYEEAKQEQDIELMRKYAKRTAALTPEMTQEAKELLHAMGIPTIQAPSEGEAQAAYMVGKGEFYGLVSQDTDGLLFGSPRIIKNLSITGRRRIRSTYRTINPEIIDLAENLNNLGIDREQLIVIAILCGTDFNVGGVKGIGPKTSLKLVKKYGKDFDAIFKEAEWEDHFDIPWREVYDVFINMPTTDDYALEWPGLQPKKIYEILVERHEFTRDRIEKVVDELQKKNAQKGLSDFF